jgi:hypothetical protein
MALSSLFDCFYVLSTSKPHIYNAQLHNLYHLSNVIKLYRIKEWLKVDPLDLPMAFDGTELIRVTQGRDQRLASNYAINLLVPEDILSPPPAELHLASNEELYSV